MSFKSKFALIILSASLAAYTIAGAWLATRAQQPANDPGAQQRIFESVLQHIHAGASEGLPSRWQEQSGGNWRRTLSGSLVSICGSAD